MRRSTWSALVLLAAVSLPAAGATAYVTWSSDRSDAKKSAAALDLETGDVLWERAFKDDVHFVEALADGILVGCENGTLYFLDSEQGATLWKVDLKRPVNIYVGSGDDGILVSNDKKSYWLVGHDGRLKHSWKH